MNLVTRVRLRLSEAREKYYVRTNNDAGRIRELERQIQFVAPPQRRRLRVDLFYLHRKQGDKKNARKYLSQASGRGNSKAHRIYRKIGEGRIEPAVEEYVGLCTSLSDERSAAIWRECLRVAYDLSIPPDPAALEDIESIREQNIEQLRSLRVATVCGMGWSGSGAVFDFLRDHPDVIDIVGESRLVEGRHGYRGLQRAKTIDDRRVQEFLSKGLVGITRCDRWDDYRHVRNARRHVSSRHPHVYAAFAYRALEQLQESRQLDPTTDLMFNELIAAAVASRMDDWTRLAILDNVIHAENLYLLEHIDSITAIPVVRDPRDQFVDNAWDNPNFHHDVDRFTEEYLRKRRIIDEALEADRRRNSGGRPRLVPPIAFEEFVTDPRTRERFCHLLSLEPPASPRGERFDPEVSRSNIELYRRFDDEDAISRLATELRAYVLEQETGR
jgi:hypothetical protein